MIKKLFSGQINSITVAALLVALSSLVSRLLGIFRDRILAGEFGAGDTLDIYYAAFRVPDLIFNLLVLGALSAGFVPLLTKMISEPLAKVQNYFRSSVNQEVWTLANNTLNALVIVLLSLSIVGIALAPLLMKIITPGFDQEKLALTVSLTRIMFLSPIFLGVSSILGGILQSFKHFFVYSLAPIMYNVGIILGALFLVPLWGIYGLAWGVILGTILHMAVQLPTVFRLGYRYALIFDLKNKKFLEIISLMIPRTMSLAITQVNFVVITIIASTLASGSLAVFNFANNLQSFPVGIFGISFAVAAFPTLSALAFNKQKLIDNLSRVLRQILFFVVPASVLLLTLRAQIIRVVLGTGKFDWEDTISTIDTLGFFTLSLFAQASIPLLVRAFYARHNSKTPFYVGLFSIIVNVTLSLWLPKVIFCHEIAGASGGVANYCEPLGVSGLALSFSIASIVNFIILWLVLRSELSNLQEARVFSSVIKFSTAALAAGIAIQGMKLLVVDFVDMTRVWGVFTQGLAAGVAGILVYLAFCSLLKSEELYSFWESIKKRLPSRKIETGDQGEARGI